jgi:predicted ATPase
MPKAKPSRRSSRSSRPNRASPPRERNEGEGNKTAARRYDSAVEATVRSGTVEQKAREAARALEGPEGGELRRAEALAKQRGKTASDGRSAHK